MALWQFPRLGIYLYASTREILQKAVQKMGLATQRFNRVSMDCGELLRLSPDETISRSTFDSCNLTMGWYQNPWFAAGSGRTHRGCNPFEEETDNYLEDLKAVAASFGYSSDSIDHLISMGFMPEELEEFIYCGEL